MIFFFGPHRQQKRCPNLRQHKPLVVELEWMRCFQILYLCVCLRITGKQHLTSSHNSFMNYRSLHERQHDTSIQKYALEYLLSSIIHEAFGANSSLLPEQEQRGSLFNIDKFFLFILSCLCHFNESLFTSPVALQFFI